LHLRCKCRCRRFDQVPSALVHPAELADLGRPHPKGRLRAVGIAGHSRPRKAPALDLARGFDPRAHDGAWLSQPVVGQLLVIDGRHLDVDVDLEGRLCLSCRFRSSATLMVRLRSRSLLWVNGWASDNGLCSQGMQNGLNTQPSHFVITWATSSSTCARASHRSRPCARRSS
jgi:hypothetical protein